MFKRISLLVACIVLTLSICGCGEAKSFYQEMTIVKDSKCKTTQNINVINEVLSVFGDMEKGDVTENSDEEWVIRVELNVDGNLFTYALNDSAFLDSDQKQYSVDGAAALEKIDSIYADLRAEEKDY